VRSYETMQVSTGGGDVLAGIVQDQGVGYVSLGVSPEKTIRIERDNIRNIEPLNISLMPVGMDQVLTLQELADLIAYLEASR
jgi:putative heme-binding domain-containing protein